LLTYTLYGADTYKIQQIKHTDKSVFFGPVYWQLFRHTPGNIRNKLACGSQLDYTV